jgi:hypothetical protein
VSGLGGDVIVELVIESQNRSGGCAQMSMYTRRRVRVESHF